MQEIPQLMSASYASNTFSPDAWVGGNARLAQGHAEELALLLNKQGALQPQLAKVEKIMMTAARIIKVFIADPNENLPLEKRVLYTGEEKLTDLTDQELFFEVPIQDLLAKHNEVRVKTVDKKQADKFGRDIMLEVAKIRDLKMVAVTVATF